jgi:TonB family protein
MKNNLTALVIFQLSRPRVVSLFAGFAVLILLFALPAHSQSARDAAARAQATALFAKALAVSDIRAPGSMPFEMRATINIKPRFGKASIGSYLLDWVSPEKWREEIHFSDYTRIRVGGRNQYWQSRTTSYELEPLLQLNGGLNFLQTLYVWSNPAAMTYVKNVKLHQEKERGTRLDCVKLIPNDSPFYSADYCFDPASGALASDSTSQTEFSDFTLFQGKYFPASIRPDDTPVAQIVFQVNSISPLGSIDSADFLPPQGSTIWPSCDTPDALPKIKSQVSPGYPAIERINHMEGSVFVYAVIGTDGKLSNLTVLSAPDRGLADSALTALSQWQYTPETCGGTPVPVETLISVVYNWGPG